MLVNIDTAINLPLRVKREARVCLSPFLTKVHSRYRKCFWCKFKLTACLLIACWGRGGLGVSRSFSSLISTLIELSFVSSVDLALTLDNWLSDNLAAAVILSDVVVVDVVDVVVASTLELDACDVVICESFLLFALLVLSLLFEIVVLLLVTDDNWLIFVWILSLFSSTVVALLLGVWLLLVDFFDLVLLLLGLPPSPSTSISLSSAENGNTLQEHTSFL